MNVTRSVNASSNATLEPWAVINMDEVGGSIDLSSFFSSASNLASANGGPGVPSWIATLQGLGGNEIFIGTSGTDTLVGRGGNDILNGGAGADAMQGGAGNDTYLVDNVGDVVTENASEGTDLVQSSVSFTLGANVDNLTLTGRGNTQTFDDMATGPIADGENGWQVLGPARDQAVVNLAAATMRSTSRAIPRAAISAAPTRPRSAWRQARHGLSPYQNQSIKFDFKAVSSTVDGSRLEIDFANAAAPIATTSC